MEEKLTTQHLIHYSHFTYMDKCSSATSGPVPTPPSFPASLSSLSSMFILFRLLYQITISFSSCDFLILVSFPPIPCLSQNLLHPHALPASQVDLPLPGRCNGFSKARSAWAGSCQATLIFFFPPQVGAESVL